MPLPPSGHQHRGPAPVPLISRLHRPTKSATHVGNIDSQPNCRRRGRGKRGCGGFGRDVAAQATAARGRRGHTTLISEAPARLSPGTRSERAIRGVRWRTRGAQKNPAAPCPRVEVPGSAYRVRGPGDRREGVGGRWKGEGAPPRVTRARVSKL